MPQGRDSFKTTLVQITRSTRGWEIETILVLETDQRHALVAYRVVIVSRRFLSSLYTLVS